MMYRNTATGKTYRPGQIVNGQQTHTRMSDAAWSALGCEPYTPPEPPPAADPYPAWRDAHREGLAAFRAAFLATAGALVAAGQTLPDPLTFRGMLDCLQSLPGDNWTRAGLALRCAYDEVLFACHGDPQMAYDYLPRILADEELV